MTDHKEHSTAKLVALCTMVGMIAASPGFWAWLDKPASTEVAELTIAMKRLDAKLDKLQITQDAMIYDLAKLKAGVK